MEWDKVWPVIISTPGGVYMAVSLWAIVTNRIALPREVLVWKSLYDEEKARSARFEQLAKDLTDDLAKQNEGHLQTISMLKELMQGKQPSYTAEHHPRRRSTDV